MNHQDIGQKLDEVLEEAFPAEERHRPRTEKAKRVESIIQTSLALYGNDHLSAYNFEDQPLRCTVFYNLMCKKKDAYWVSQHGMTYRDLHYNTDAALIRQALAWLPFEDGTQESPLIMAKNDTPPCP